MKYGMMFPSTRVRLDSGPSREVQMGERGSIPLHYQYSSALTVTLKIALTIFQTEEILVIRLFCLPEILKFIYLKF